MANRATRFDDPSGTFQNSAIADGLARGPLQIAEWGLGVDPKAALTTAGFTWTGDLQPLLVPLVLREPFVLRSYALPVQSLGTATNVEASFALYQPHFEYGPDRLPNLVLLRRSRSVRIPLATATTVEKADSEERLLLSPGYYYLAVNINKSGGAGPTLRSAAPGTVAAYSPTRS